MLGPISVFLKVLHCICRIMKTLFITGTDTDVGKTYVSELLYEYAESLELRPALFKPIASGCACPGDPLSNPDLQQIFELTKVPLELINRWCFDEPIAPHIAAAQHETLTLGGFDQAMLELYNARQEHDPFDCGFIEGAGGWMLPLNESETLDQWVVSAGLPVILVVGMKLGCLNHALLTAKVMVEAGARVLGWIANSPAPMARYKENLRTLQQALPFPLLAEVATGQTTVQGSRLGQIFNSY